MIFIMIFIIALLSTVFLYIKSRIKYDELIDPLDKEEFKLKRLLCIGFFIVEKLCLKFKTGYDNKLIVKIRKIYGTKFAEYYLRVFWANQITSFIFVTVIMLFIGAAYGEYDEGLLMFIVAMPFVMVFALNKELDDKVNKKRTMIFLEFPNFINKLGLLVNAGITVTKAWEKIVSENKKDSLFYREISCVSNDVKQGKSEIHALEDFARNLGIPEISRFISVVVQNLKKGNSEMVALLRIMSNDAWEMRRNAAKRLGEEASTKMILPLILMLGAILLIVAMPAVISLKNVM